MNVSERVRGIKNFARRENSIFLNNTLLLNPLTLPRKNLPARTLAIGGALVSYALNKLLVPSILSIGSEVPRDSKAREVILYATGLEIPAVALIGFGLSTQNHTLLSLGALFYGADKIISLGAEFVSKAQQRFGKQTTVKNTV